MISLRPGRAKLEFRGTRSAAARVEAAPCEQYPTERMSKFATVIRVAVMAYIAAIGMLIVLRGIDAALHG